MNRAPQNLCLAMTFDLGKAFVSFTHLNVIALLFVVAWAKEIWACKTLETVEMNGNFSAQFVKLPDKSVYAEKEGLHEMLHQTMEPFTSSLVRISLPGDMSSQGTALAKPVETSTVDWTFLPTVGTTSIIQTQSTISFGNVRPSLVNPVAESILGDYTWQPFVLLTDPVVGMITRRIAPKIAWTLAAPGVTPTVYTMLTCFPGVIVKNPAGTPSMADFVGGPSSCQPIPLTHGVFGGGPWKPYGDYFPCGDVCGSRVFWADGADSLDNTGATVNNGQAWKITLELQVLAGFANLTGADWKVEIRLHSSNSSSSVIAVVDGITLTAGVSTIFNLPAVNTSGYFSISFLFEDANIFAPMVVRSVLLGLNCVSSFHHVSLSGQQNKPGIVDSIRVNGAGLLLSNTVTEISKGGSVYALQSPGETPWWYWMLSLTNITNANTMSRTVMGWNKGLYTFVKPQSGNPLALTTAYYKPALTSRQTARYLPMFEPFSSRSYVVALCVPATVSNNAASVVYPTSQVTYTICRAIEFTTTDQFFNVDVSRLSTSFFNDYVDALRVVPQFYENPLHLGAVGKIISSIAQKVVEWAPSLISGLTVAKKYANEINQGQGPLVLSRKNVQSLPAAQGASRPKKKGSMGSKSSTRSKRSARVSVPGSTVKVKLTKAQKKKLKKQTGVADLR